jgi:hypothetical protein
LKFTKSCKKYLQEILQEIYQSSNQEMFAISQCPLFMTVRHIFEISEDDHTLNTPTPLVTHARNDS